MMRNKTKKAFSLVELLITLLIVGILGGGAAVAIWYFIASFYQMDDYTVADMEIESAFRRVAREFALIGLGMPNNRGGEGTFAMSFYEGADFNRSPIMARFGTIGSDWGGPVTVSAAPSGSPATPVMPGRDGAAFVGPELYYAWAVPTGVRARITNLTNPSAVDILNEDRLGLALFPPPPGSVNTLQNFRWDGRNIGIPNPLPGTNTGRDARTWLGFPTLRLPMRVDSWTATGLVAVAAPVPSSALASLASSPIYEVSMSRPQTEMDEIHLIQAARIYRDAGTNELRRVVFGADYAAAGGNHQEEVLARNIVALQFRYDPEERLLTVFIAARGAEINASGAGHPDYPGWLPATQRVSPDDARYRTLAKTLTWRIRN